MPLVCGEYGAAGGDDSRGDDQVVRSMFRPAAVNGGEQEPIRFGRGEPIRLDRQGLQHFDEELVAAALREDLGAVGG